MKYFKLVIGVILILFGFYTVIEKIANDNYRDSPIGYQKIVYSGVLCIILGVMLIFDFFE